ncbi:MAG TPA: SCO family protein [Methylocystis sp.]|nr:SCO family protein [Methylocystis sp.]
MSNAASKKKSAAGRASKPVAAKPAPKPLSAKAPPGPAAAKAAPKAQGFGIKPLIGMGVAAALLFGAFVAYTNKQAAPLALGGPFELTNQTGARFGSQDMLGKPYLVFFGYTSCQDICHTTLFEMSEIMRALGPDAPIGGLFVTVDPERDTPAVLKDYLASFDPRIVGLTGAHEALDPMLQAYKVFAKRTPGANGDYSVDHNVVVYLMDKTGKFVSTFDVSRKPADAARDLKRYL